MFPTFRLVASNQPNEPDMVKGIHFIRWSGALLFYVEWGPCSVFAVGPQLDTSHVVYVIFDFCCSEQAVSASGDTSS
jgi:hypothetical protein